MLRRALPARWRIEAPLYLMCHTGPMTMACPLAAGFHTDLTVAHGGYLIRIFDAEGVVAASGDVALHGGTAVLDQIATHEHYRRQGPASALMLALDGLAVQAGVTERLLSATEAGAALYTALGWQHLAPYASAVLPAWFAGSAQQKQRRGQFRQTDIFELF